VESACSIAASLGLLAESLHSLAENIDFAAELAVWIVERLDLLSAIPGRVDHSPML
jgi:hypothetical protein